MYFDKFQKNQSTFLDHLTHSTHFTSLHSLHFTHFTSQPDSKGSTRGEGWPYSPHPSVLHPSSTPTKDGGCTPRRPQKSTHQ